MDSQKETLAYYDHNAEKYAKRTLPLLDLEAIHQFTMRLPAHGRILDAGCGAGRDLSIFSQMGFEVEGFDGSSKLVEIASKRTGLPVKKTEFMLLSLAKEKYDGIWANRSLIHLPPAGCLRAVATFFAALKPGGILFASIEEGSGTRLDRTDDASGPARHVYLYSSDEFGSLLRQNGFKALVEGRDLANGGRIGVIAQRL